MSSFTEKYKMTQGESRQFFNYLTGSGLAITISKTILAPLERLKIIYQTQNTLLGKERIKNISEYISFTRETQGIKGFWRGNLAHIMTLLPKSIIQFGFYDNIKRFYFEGGRESYDGYSYYLRELSVSLTSGFLTLLFVYPFETARTRLSLEFSKNETRIYKTITQTLKHLNLNTGFASIYKGFLLSNIMNIPFSISFFANIETLKYCYSQNPDFFLNAFGVGNLAAFFSSCFVYPFDTVRRKLMLIDPTYTVKYNGSLDCFKLIFEKEGIQGFYKGFGLFSLRFAIICPMNLAILMAIKG